MIWRWPALFLLFTLGLATAWATGFTAYCHNARLKASAPHAADGIVVLTGGADRIETALRLLAQGTAPALLVSGVGRGIDLAELAKRVHLDPTAIEDRVTLGREATTTIGNAAETASWARQNGVQTLIVVTAGYHMERALLELGRSLPWVSLVPVPVQPPAMRGRMDVATIRLLALEYDKLLAVRLGVNAVVTPVLSKGARS